MATGDKAPGRPPLPGLTAKQAEIPRGTAFRGDVRPSPAGAIVHRQGFMTMKKTAIEARIGKQARRPGVLEDLTPAGRRHKLG